MKKVLISAYSCRPDSGSEEANGWYFSSLVSRQGYEVVCLTRELARQPVEAKLRDVPHPNLTFAYVAVPRWVDASFRKGLIGMYLHYIYWQWAAWRTAAELDKTHRFDLAHHVSYTSLQLGSFLYKLHKPFIYGPVGGGQEAPRSMRRYFRRYWWKEQLRSAISKLMLRFNPGCFESVRKASFVLVKNDDTRQLAHSLGRSEGIVLELGGVGPDFLPKQPVQREPQPVLNLLWVGRLMPRKALELSLHGLSLVNPKLPIRLTIVGDGEMGQYVPEYLATYGLADRVKWVGKVDFAQTKAYYHAADVFLFTSLRDTQPTQVLEAMAHALPVVTLDLHGQANMVCRDTGLCIPVTDPDTVADKLAGAIEWYYYHPTERIQMGLNAFHRAHDLNWQSRIEHIVHTYYTPLLEEVGVGV
jgi:glycosyltransferase involved in cell wall biosynthesis